MAASRPAQGQNSTRPLTKISVSVRKPRVNGAPRASNNKRKQAFG